VDDPGLVGGVDGPGQGHHQLGGLAAGLGGAGQPVIEAAAFEQLQCDERQAAGFADVVDLQDVGMPQPRHRLGLDAKSRQVIGSGLAAAANHLEGDQAVQPTVSRLVNDPHAALAQPLEDVVAGNGWPVRRRRFPVARMSVRIDCRSAGGPVGVARLGYQIAGCFVHIPGGAGRRSPAKVIGYIQLQGRVHAPAWLPGSVRLGPVGFSRHPRIRLLAGHVLRRGQFHYRVKEGLHGLDRRCRSRRWKPFGQSLETPVACDTVFDVRYDPDVNGPVEPLVEKSQ
jgi:hypothetical protein